MDPRREDGPADVGHENHLEDHQTHHHADAQGAVEEHQPDGDRGDDGKTGRRPGTEQALDHLPVRFSLSLDLGHPGIEEPQVGERNDQPDRHANPGQRREEQGHHDADRPHRERSDDGSAQHFGQHRLVKI